MIYVELSHAVRLLRSYLLLLMTKQWIKHLTLQMRMICKEKRCLKDYGYDNYYDYYYFLTISAIQLFSNIDIFVH